MGKQAEKFWLLFLFNVLFSPLFSSGHQLNNTSTESEVDARKNGAVIDKSRSFNDGLHHHHLLNERVSKIELNHEEQEKFSALIKTLLNEDREEINQLRGRVAELEDLVVASIPTATSSKSDDKTNKEINEERIINKRPARLLPLQLLFDQDENEDKEKQLEEESKKRFYGPATNCTDLSKLGYTLNGYYLLNGDKNIKSNKSKNIKVVDCRFKKPYGKEGEKQKLETLVGKVEISDESAIQELRKSFESQVNKIHETVKGLESRVEKVNETMKDESNRLMNAKISLESKVEKVNATIKGVESKVEKVNATMEEALYLLLNATVSLKSQVEKVNPKIKGLESNVEKLNEKIKAADDKEKRLGFSPINNENKTNPVTQSLSEDKEDCLYELKNWNGTCLVDPNGMNTSIMSGSLLAELPCKSVKNEQLWKRKHLHICSNNKNNKCLTVSPNYKIGGHDLHLMAHKPLEESQQWIIGSTMSGLQMIVNVGAYLCLYDPFDMYVHPQTSTIASTRAWECRRGRDFRFSFDLANSINPKNCSLDIHPDIEEGIEEIETLKLKIRKYISKKKW